MGINIITGRLGSGKSYEVFSKIKNLIYSGSKGILLVPEQYTLQAERELIDFLDIPGLLDVEVLSPTRLMDNVFAQVGGRLPNMDARGKAMIIRMITGGLKDQLTVFSSLSDSSGLATSLSDLISDLKRFDVMPDDLLEGVKSQGLLSMKLRDIALIYKTYNEFLQEKRFYDAEDNMQAFLDVISASTYFEDKHVFVDEFDYLPPRTVRFLMGIYEKSQSLTITAPTCPNTYSDYDVFAPGQAGIDTIKRFTSDFGINYNIEHLTENKREQHPSLKHLEKNLFAYPAQDYIGESCIEIREASTTYAEINAAACEIVRLVRDEGLRYREIGVACADLEGYTSLIRRAFANHNIPCFLDDRRQVSQHPAVDYILSLLKVGAYNWRKGDVLRMLKTGHANLPGGAVEKLQRYLSKLPGNRDYFYKREWKRPYEDFDLLEINDWRESFIKAPLKLFKRTKKGANGLEWAQYIYELLEDISMGDTLRAAEEQLKADGNIDLAAESTQVWNAVLELLDQMAIIMMDTILTTSDVLQLLETGFRATKVGVLPTGTDQVNVGNIGRSKVGNIQVMIVLGANEGLLPMNYTEGDVLTDSDMDALGDTGLTTGRDGDIRCAQGRMGAYTTLVSPKRKLYISYSLGDSKGNAKRPAPLVLRMRDIFSLTIKKADTWLPTTAKAAFPTAATTFSDIRHDNPASDYGLKVLGTLKSMEEYNNRFTMMDNIRLQSDRNVSGDLMPSEMYSSVSQLETYASCPFKWFVGSALRPIMWDEEGLDLTSIGIFAHRAATLFGEQLKNIDMATIDETAAQNIMEKIADDMIISDPEMSYTPQSEWIASMAKAACIRSAKSYVKQLKNEKFIPEGFEIAFGEGSPFPPISLELDDGRAVLRGRVDRVDVYSTQDYDYLRVVDYKTGSTKMSREDIVDGSQIQLWVYLKALCDSWEKIKGRKAKPAGVFYQPIKNSYVSVDDLGDEISIETINDNMSGMFTKSEIPEAVDESGYVVKKGSERSTKEMEQIQKRVLEDATDTLKNMSQGNANAYPLNTGQGTACDYCDYRTVCGFGLYKDDKPKKKSKVSDFPAWMEDKDNG